MQVHTIKVEKKLGEVVNRLNRTREEKYPNLREEREKRDRHEEAELRHQQQEKVTTNNALVHFLDGTDVLPCVASCGFCHVLHTGHVICFIETVRTGREGEIKG